MAETPTAVPQPVHRIVIVGGGAGGLPLATMLGDTLGDKRNGRADITLVDRFGRISGSRCCTKSQREEWMPMPTTSIIWPWGTGIISVFGKVRSSPSTGHGGS
jgi:hypothetical protein